MGEHRRKADRSRQDRLFCLRAGLRKLTSLVTPCVAASCVGELDYSRAVAPLI
jgi:hypothetical protein